MAKFYTPEVDSAITNVHINIEHVTYFTTTKLDDGSVDVAFYFGTGLHRSTPPTIKVNMGETNRRNAGPVQSYPFCHRLSPEGPAADDYDGPLYR